MGTTHSAGRFGKPSRLWYPLAAAAVVGLATCAPVDPPTEKTKDPAHHDHGSEVVEVLKPPTEVSVQDSVSYRVKDAIESVKRRELDVSHGFWTIFHGILGLGPSVQMKDDRTGKKVNALDWICDGKPIPGLLFLPTPYGLDVQNGGDYKGQGHQDQFVAEMAEWGMKADRKFRVGTKDYTFRDFANHSKMRVKLNAKQELSWAIIIIAEHFGTNCEWDNADGEHIRYEDIVRYELDQSVNEAACGGTHRLFGLTWALHRHLQEGGKREGVWKEICERTVKYRDLAKQHRNSDGSLSTSYFRGPGSAQELGVRISTTGHMVEWLAFALSDEELKEPWMQEAVSALSVMILDTEGKAAEGGGLYHAVHGLLIYYARAYDAKALGANRPTDPMPPPGMFGTDPL
jgi:hypothetical protein